MDAAASKSFIPPDLMVTRKPGYDYISKQVPQYTFKQAAIWMGLVNDM